MTMNALAGLICSTLASIGEVAAQGVWLTPFRHQPSGPEVHPASVSANGATASRWITEAYYTPGNPGTVSWPVPGTKFNAIHSCLIPAGPFRGCVLVMDGNHRAYGTRAYQPWAIVNPYWPKPNPFVASMPGGGNGFRFYNAALQMPVDPATGQVLGELFCAGHRWTSDGRLFLAGGTRVYPPVDPGNPGNGVPAVNTGMPEMWEGAKFV